MTRCWIAMLLPATLGVLGGCAEQAPSPPAPRVAMIVVGDAEPTDGAVASLSGDVRARVDSTLSFRVGGQIIERVVRRGQQVRRGQVLARLDTSDVLLGASEARALVQNATQAVAAARAIADRAEADERRLAPLVGAGGIAPQQYDAVRAAMQAANADLAAARARLAAAQTGVGRANNQVRYATLVADADGVIVDLLAEPGQVVSAGQPIARIARSGGRDAVVAIPERLRGGLPRSATVAVYGGARFPATLREISAAADPATRTFEARFAIEGGAQLPIGSTVALAIESSARTASTGGMRVAVPLAALINRGSGAGVWVIGPDMKVVRRPVAVVSISDGKAQVTGSLRRGERIVALGAHLLSAGQSVRVGALPR